LKASLIRQFAEFILFIGQSNITKHIYWTFDRTRIRRECSIMIGQFRAALGSLHLL